MNKFTGRLDGTLEVTGLIDLHEPFPSFYFGTLVLPADGHEVVTGALCRLDVDGGVSINVRIGRVSSGEETSADFMSQGLPLRK